MTIATFIPVVTRKSNYHRFSIYVFHTMQLFITSLIRKYKVW